MGVIRGSFGTVSPGIIMPVSGSVNMQGCTHRACMHERVGVYSRMDMSSGGWLCKTPRQIDR